MRMAVDSLKRQIRLDLDHPTLNRMDGGRPLAAKPGPTYAPPPGYTGWTPGAVLIHVHEEVAQHHGRTELTPDALLQMG